MTILKPKTIVVITFRLNVNSSRYFLLVFSFKRKISWKHIVDDKLLRVSQWLQCQEPFWGTLMVYYAWKENRDYDLTYLVDTSIHILVNVGYHCLECCPSHLQRIELLLVIYDAIHWRWSYEYLLFEEIKSLSLLCCLLHLHFFDSFKAEWHNHCPMRLHLEKAADSVVEKL